VANDIRGQGWTRNTCDAANRSIHCYILSSSTVTRKKWKNAQVNPDMFCRYLFVFHIDDFIFAFWCSFICLVNCHHLFSKRLSKCVTRFSIRKSRSSTQLPVLFGPSDDHVASKATRSTRSLFLGHFEHHYHSGKFGEFTTGTRVPLMAADLRYLQHFAYYHAGSLQGFEHRSV